MRSSVELNQSQVEEMILLYTHGMNDAQIASYFMVAVKGLQVWIHKRQNTVIRLRIEQAKVMALARMRQALYTKGIGQQYREGRPRVVENGIVVDQGQPAQAASPGDLAAQKYWLENCDDTKHWIGYKSPQTPETEDGSMLAKVSRMSENELINFIIDKMKDGLIPKEQILGRPQRALPSPDITATTE